MRLPRFLLALALLPGLALAQDMVTRDGITLSQAQETRAEAIGGQLRCLVCQNESIEESTAGLARDLRALVRRHIMRGDSNKQIIAFLVARYGNFVRLDPPIDPATWLLWGSPIVAIAGGLGFVAVRLARRQPPPPPDPLDTTERERLARLLTGPAKV